jgi:hypothetical protein
LILEGIAFLAAAIATAVIGTPIASSLARPAKFRRVEGAGTSSKRTRTDVVRAFEPLDLGPDPIKWPSERAWNLASTLQVPAWPSQSWNDEHFGRHWRDGVKQPDDLGFHAMAARRLNEEGVVVASAAAANAPKREPKKAQPKPAPKPQPPKPQAKPAQGAAPAKEKGPRRRQGSGVDQAKGEVTFFQEPPKAPAAGTPQGVPDPAEIEHLISTVGLAGTVQTIMSRTGWDFREAAQYLARIRQKG